MSVLKRAKGAVKTALAVPQVRKSYEATQRAVLGVAAVHRLPATVYTSLGLATFNREQYAVLAGRSAYYRNLHKARSSHVELRRNIHRLEKGILMEPRRAVFARDYIGETVDFYREALAGCSTDPGIESTELSWAFDVLQEYFSIITEPDPVVERARRAFQELSKPACVVDPNLRPYAHSQIERSSVSYEELLKLARQRRSVRWFEDRPVPRELIDKALLVGREAPSACNRLPYEYLVFDEPDEVRKVAAIPFGAAGYSHQIPTVIVVKGRLDSYFSPRDRHVIYIDTSLAAMGFMLGLETLGLSSSVINWPDFEPLEMKIAKVLNLEPYERVLFMIAVGFPRQDAMVASSAKKSLDILRQFNVPTH